MPEYGKALKRTLDGEEGRVGGAVGGARVFGLRERLGFGDGEAMEVFRCMFTVSAEGGRGRKLLEFVGENTDARQRKHSPVPK